MSANTFLNDYGRALGPGGNHTIAAPSSGGTFKQKGMAFGTATVGTGTFKLPDNGLPMFVKTTGTATLTNFAGTHVVTMNTGQLQLLLPTSSTTWATLGGSQAGFIDLPLSGWREISSNDVINAAGNGGVLATDTTPTLETVNGDTDGQLRVLWAAGNADALARQITLPTDLDRTQPIVVHFRGTMSDSNDTPVMDIDTFFDEGDTKVEDATGVWGPSVSDRTATIAAADIPSSAATMSIEITPGAHASDTMALYASWLTYTKKVV